MTERDIITTKNANTKYFIIVTTAVVVMWILLFAFNLLNVKKENIYLQKDAKSGYVAIDPAALSPLDTSDKLSKEQIQTIVDYIHDTSRYSNECDLNGLADKLYDWQNKNDTSVLGVLAIMETEGIFDSTLFNRFYNTGVITADTDVTDLPMIPDTNYLDCRKLYNTPADAVVDYMDRVNTFYISKDQDSYYSMCYMLKDGSLYNATNKAEADKQTELITHSYCPYWEDVVKPSNIPSMEYNTCWVNNCAMNRKKLESLVL